MIFQKLTLFFTKEPMASLTAALPLLIQPTSGVVSPFALWPCFLPSREIKVRALRNPQAKGQKLNNLLKKSVSLYLFLSFQRNIRVFSSKKDIIQTNYTLETYQRSNQDTCLTHKPAVLEGSWVQSGDLLTDCTSSIGGELSLGQNLLIAYMPWEGYNFEDAILISDRLVIDDLYTSVHIERYEIQIHRTKLGVEEITQDIPNIAQKEIQNLDSFGIVKIGTWVEEGDILVGKITPINKKKISPYQKLLYTILEKQVKPFRDSSLRAPRGIKAKVIDIKFFYQSDKNPLFLSKLDFTKQQLKKRFSFDSVLAYSPPFRLCRSLCPYPFGAMDRSQKLKGTKAKFSFFPFDHNFLSLEKKAILKKKICEIKTNLEENKLLYEKKLTLPALFLNVSKNKHRSILYSDFDPYFFFPLEKESLLQPLSLLPQAKVSPFNRSERVGCPSIFGARARDRSPKGFTLTTETFPSFPRGGPKIKREGNTINLNEPFLYLSSDGKRQRKQPKAKNSIESVDFPSTSIRSARKNLYINKILKLNQEKNQHYWSHKLTKISTIHIYLAEKRKIQIGDKMAGRHGNKGIVSQILPIQDMPYLPDGTPIDMVLNPLGVPSRMNVGQIYECLLGLAGKYLGEHFKVFAFDEMYGPEASRSFVFNKLYYARQKTGFNWLFDPNAPGKMRLYDGRSGECFHQKITVGQAYILRLVHMVDDKMHMRSTGPYSLVTQQPLRGRSKQGGQRLGEMEVWALEGYGAAFSLLEMLTIKSDDMTGRMTLWSNLILNKEIAIGTPESFKVLVCELQALCLDIGLYRLKNTKQNEKQNFNIKNVSEKHYKTSLEEIDQLMNLL